MSSTFDNFTYCDGNDFSTYGYLCDCYCLIKLRDSCKNHLKSKKHKEYIKLRRVFDKNGIYHIRERDAFDCKSCDWNGVYYRNGFKKHIIEHINSAEHKKNIEKESEKRKREIWSWFR